MDRSLLSRLHAALSAKASDRFVALLEDYGFSVATIESLLTGQPAAALRALRERYSRRERTTSFTWVLSAGVDRLNAAMAWNSVEVESFRAVVFQAIEPLMEDRQDRTAPLPKGSQAAADTETGERIRKRREDLLNLLPRVGDRSQERRSQLSLATELGCSERSVREDLKVLRKEGLIDADRRRLK